MLAGLLGIRLVLLVGPSVPLPAPASLSAALSQVQVTNDADNGDGFQMTFTLSRENPSDYALLQSGLLDPPSRVVIGVVLGVKPEVLIDGVIMHHQLHPGHGADEPATLTVTGRPVSAMMNLEERNDQYPNQPDFVIVTRLIAEYASLGLVPAVTPTTNVPIMTGRIPRQHETDLCYIERLAADNGFVFYVEPVTFLVNKAYWGPENRLGIPQRALTTNMGSWDNVSQLSFSNDALAPVGTRAAIVEPITKMKIPIPVLPSLKTPPLAASPARALRVRLKRDAAKQKPGEAMTGVIASATRAADAVTAQGEVDSIRYGEVLRARRVVGVRGAGLTYDGNYFVKKVSHTIERGSYRQTFTLSREGTRSIMPLVRP